MAVERREENQHEGNRHNRPATMKHEASVPHGGTLYALHSPANASGFLLRSPAGHDRPGMRWQGQLGHCAAAYRGFTAHFYGGGVAGWNANPRADPDYFHQAKPHR